MKVAWVLMHMVVVLVLIDTEGVTDATVIVTELEVAVLGEAHVELEVITHDTVCPFVSVVVVNVGLLVPVFVPLTFH